MRRRLSLFTRFISSIHSFWPARRFRRPSSRGSRRRSGPLRPHAARLEIQSLETKLALAADTGTKVVSVFAPPAGNYRAGDVLEVKVVYNAAVTVVNTPQLDLTIGKTVRQAAFVPNSAGDPPQAVVGHVERAHSAAARAVAAHARHWRHGQHLAL